MVDRRIAARHPPLAAATSLLSRVWARDRLRLPVLTFYYLAIIVALIILYGGTTYTPPPFIYQGF